MRDCQECGESISEKRLAAKPNAKRCTSCESKHDSILREPRVEMGRLFGHGSGYPIPGKRNKTHIPFAVVENEIQSISPFIVDPGLLAIVEQVQAARQ